MSPTPLPEPLSDFEEYYNKLIHNKKSMALIKCPECSTEVSDKAEKCPKCAYPILGQSIQTIEQTSKIYKKQIIYGWIVFFVGIVIFMFSQSLSGKNWGAFIALMGFIWFLFAKVSIWWHHK
jgi:DNA-directed RNA polymerase subunit RPC12/RpoP